MFGYVRPAAEELKVREFERFRACYCGLCHELGRLYGLPGRSILNYDFVFLAMLLWGGEGECGYCMRRCAPGLFRKKCVCSTARPLTVAAGYSVILAYWKARDDLADSRGLKKLPAMAAALWLRRGYRRAAAAHPGFDADVHDRLAALAALEAEGTESLDRPADQFARLLASAASEADEPSRRALGQLLYHVGRIIYIADAWSDLADDLKSGSFNPLARRFGLTSAQVPAEAKERVWQTLNSSVNLACAAFELLDDGYWSSVTKNIVYLGVPRMIDEVLAGTYRAPGRRIPTRPQLGQNGE